MKCFVCKKELETQHVSRHHYSTIHSFSTEVSRHYCEACWSAPSGNVGGDSFAVRMIKKFILSSMRPLERRGIALTNRARAIPLQIANRITRHVSNSFCPFAHFETAWRALVNIGTNSIPGDVVICGVAKGGLAAFIAELCPRPLWLYDMFDGGTLPGINDGEFAVEHGEEFKRQMAADQIDVERYVRQNAVSPDIRFIVGDVRETIPAHAPKQIALLYLDTDYYDSTAHELRHLEPLVSPGGIIIQDDMGLCVGAKRAVDEYYLGKQHLEGRTYPMQIFMSEAGACWVKS